MAVSAAAALLDELMGRNRNINPNDPAAKLTWDSPEVCRHFLIKFCPHDLFTNTKSDLGLCEKVHDDDLKKEFDDANNITKRMQYEDDFIRYADTMLIDVDKRIRKGRQRLALSLKDALSNVTTGDVAVDEQIELLSERITGLVNEAERLGNEGNVEEAQGLSKLCEKLQEERNQLKKAHENTVWHQAAEMAASQEKQMEVCTICGAFLIVGDAQQRIDDHLTGKQHLGFEKLRNAIQDIKDSREKLRQDRDKEREERRKRLEQEDGARRRDDRPREDHYSRDRRDRERSSRDPKSRDRSDREHKSRDKTDRDRSERRRSRDRDHRRRDDRRDDHRRRDDRGHGYGY